MLLRLIIALIGLSYSSILSAQSIKVVATLPVFAQLAKQIGREQVDVTLLKDYSTDPHYFNMTPNQMHQIFEADLIIGPVEIIQRLPVDRSKKIDISLAFHLQNLLASKRLLALVRQDEGIDGVSTHNTFLELTHEWISFDALGLLAQITADAYTKLDPQNECIYQGRANELTTKLEDLKEKYQKTALSKPSLFYHNDFWIIEQELDTNFGPALYSCEESGLSPHLKTLLSEQSQNYQSFILDRAIPLSSLSRIISLLNCPVRQIDALGDISQGIPDWLEALLEAVYVA